MPDLLSRPAAHSIQDLGFLLLPKFSMLCFSAALEPLRAANRMAGRPLYRWTLFSPDGAPVAGSNGIALPVERGLDAKADLAALFVLASFEPERAWSPRLAEWLRALRHRGTALGAFDTGSYILARGGLLDGYRATVHWEELDAFAERFPAVNVVPDRFVIDRGRLTAGGGTTALDLMLHVIRAQHGAALALDVASQFIYGPEALSSDSQRSVSLRGVQRRCPPLARAIEIMEAAVEEPLPVHEVARRTGVGERRLERLFLRHLRTTPLRYYLDLRLSLGHRMLRQTMTPVAGVAVRCGFNSASAFARAFRARFGFSPSQCRRQA